MMFEANNNKMFHEIIWKKLPAKFSKFKNANDSKKWGTKAIGQKGWKEWLCEKAESLSLWILREYKTKKLSGLDWVYWHFIDFFIFEKIV